MQILHSSLTIFIMFAWRFLCALSIQDLILCSIFIDKLWVILGKSFGFYKKRKEIRYISISLKYKEFVVKSHYIGWLSLIGLSILTELHVAQVRSIECKMYRFSQLHVSSRIQGYL